MNNPPTGTVTFLFTDIEGSTKRWEHQPQAMRTALRRHDDLLRNAIEAHGGYVFKTIGDAFCAAFPTALDALSGAIAAQRALDQEDWAQIGEIGSIRVRMALHTGAADEWDGDYFGPPVNRVARLLSAGHGGQTLLSQSTRDLVSEALVPGIEVRDMGERRLKDLIRPEHIFQLVTPDMPSDFPPLKTLDNRPNNLPAQPTAFIGRERELQAASALLRRGDVYWVTMTGPGGTGKSRLGLQTAANLVDEFEHGVYFVNLATLSDPSLVISRIAQTLRVKEVANQPLLDSLKEYLHDKQLLLLLDNFEQVSDAAPPVAELLEAAPRLKILVTSRRLLRIYGEHNLPVPPMQLPSRKRPPSLEQLTQYETVRLFMERAVSVKPRFRVNSNNARAVAEICHLLDGLPLAIELAAARIQLFTPQAMLGKLESRLRLLTGGARNLPARQQTLRNAIGWSYELLGEQEQRLFGQLAVFVGGWSVQAADAVCNSDAIVGHPKASIDMLGGLSSLADESLLRQEEGEGGELRFQMLVTIREYALEQLEKSGEAQILRREHARFFLNVAEEAEPQLTGAQQIAWLSRLEEEHDNLRAALGWSTGGQGDTEIALRLGWALWRFWARHSHFTEGRSWLEAALKAGSAAPAVLRAKALYSLAIMLRRQGRYESAIPFYEEALALFRRLGDKQLMSWALNDLGGMALNVGNYERAITRLEESLVLKRELGNKWDIAVTLGNLGDIARLQNDYERAAVLVEESLDLCRQMGEAVDKHTMGFALNNLGYIELYRGNYERAAEYFEEGLALLQQVGDKQVVAVSLSGLAGVAGSAGKLEKAARLFSAASAQLEDLNTVLDIGDQQSYDRNLATVRTKVDEATWQAAWAEGQAMSLEEAIEYALEGIEVEHE